MENKIVSNREPREKSIWFNLAERSFLERIKNENEIIRRMNW